MLSLFSARDSKYTYVTHVELKYSTTFRNYFQTFHKTNKTDNYIRHFPVFLSYMSSDSTKHRVMNEKYISKIVFLFILLTKQSPKVLNPRVKKFTKNGEIIKCLAPCIYPAWGEGAGRGVRAGSAYG